MTKKIPVTVQTSLVNVTMNIYELNKKKGAKSYIMVVDQETDMTIVGCACLADIIFYADYFHRFKELIALKDITVMRALIADPADLPFSLPIAANVFVLHDEFGINKFKFMYEATDHIESIMASMFSLNAAKDVVIEDFAVLIGIELSDVLKARVVTKIEEKRLERTENQVMAGETKW